MLNKTQDVFSYIRFINGFELRQPLYHGFATVHLRQEHLQYAGRE